LSLIARVIWSFVSNERSSKLLESMALQTPSAYARREHEAAIDERTWKVVPEETARLRAGAPTYASWSSSSTSS
jgi:hypothetical protein